MHQISIFIEKKFDVFDKIISIGRRTYLGIILVLFKIIIHSMHLYLPKYLFCVNGAHFILFLSHFAMSSIYKDILESRDAT